MSDKKITRVNKGVDSSGSTDSFVPSEDMKMKSTTFRVIAGILWALAIGAQIWAIIKLNTVKEDGMTFLIVLIVVALIFAVIGNLLWKRANRANPASKKDKFRFFVQNQLGAIISVIAFLPLVILILTNKDLDGKQKGILGGIAGAALLIAGLTGVDFNPPSVEQYTEESNRVKELMGGNDFVYWTKSGTKYHLFEDCGYINSDRTSEIFTGTVGDAKADKNISELCSRCEGQAEKEKEENMLDLGGDESDDSEELDLDEAA